MVIADGTIKRIEPCVGYIESDYEPGTYYPCATCNPNWARVSIDAAKCSQNVPSAELAAGDEAQDATP
jgi:hypothetical protein